MTRCDEGHAYWWESSTCEYCIIVRVFICLWYNAVMSSYLNSLDPIARGRYEEKLTLMGLSTLEYPYEVRNTDMFVKSMSLWPPVEYGHIFLLFCGATWCFYKKRVDALEKHGSLQLLPEWSCSPDQSVQGSIQQHLDGLGESSPDNAHHARVGLRSDGEVITVHCTCMAG